MSPYPKSGNVIFLHDTTTMSNPELVAYYARIEDNAEAAVTALRAVTNVLNRRQPLTYDDFHDVFPEDEGA